VLLMWWVPLRVDEWPFSVGDFRLLSPRFGVAGWYFCPFDGSPWVLVSEDSGCDVEVLVLELRWILNDSGLSDFSGCDNG
jgi:hypothetical protein